MMVQVAHRVVWGKFDDFLASIALRGRGSGAAGPHLLMGRTVTQRFIPAHSAVPRPCLNFYTLLSDLTLDICRSNTMPAVSTPRSLDLVHLRTALSFNSVESIDRFITNDEPQRQAAKELGLPT